MKNIIVSYENNNGIVPYFAAAQQRKLSAALFSDKKLAHWKITLAIKLYEKGISWPYLSLLGDWFQELREIKGIVFTANRETKPVLDYLARKWPEISLHLYYLNNIENEITRVNEWQKYPCQIWTFDRKDSIQFGLRVIAQPICKENFKKMHALKIRQDIIFIGEDKKRLIDLLKLKKEWQAIGITTCFEITGTYPLNRTEGINYHYAQPVPYQKVIEKHSQSNCILEIVQKGQESSTMRPIEAGFLKKKLITNNQSIKKEPYYNSNNIFILNENNHDQIKDFLDNKFDDSIDFENYEIENWLKNF